MEINPVRKFVAETKRRNPRMNQMVCPIRGYGYISDASDVLTWMVETPNLRFMWKGFRLNLSQCN